jgi:hypothetical protein
MRASLHSWLFVITCADAHVGAVQGDEGSLFVVAAQLDRGPSKNQTCGD